MRFVSLVIGFVFVLFCAVQYNDPDPYTWIAIYGLVVVASLLVYFRKASEWFLWTILPLYLGASIYFWPEKFEGVSMPMHTKPWIEEAREALGLLIAFMSLLTLLFIQRKTKVQEN
jgi:hypothetical protein